MVTMNHDNDCENCPACTLRRTARALNKLSHEMREMQTHGMCSSMVDQDVITSDQEAQICFAMDTAMYAMMSAYVAVGMAVGISEDNP